MKLLNENLYVFPSLSVPNEKKSKQANERH